jgi:predicted nucleotidyltransferase
MQPTPYPDINELLDSLLREIQAILGPKLGGLYLYGSLVTGDFDMGISDIDLLAVTASDIDDAEFEELDRMHLDFVRRNKEWKDRIEIAYLSAAALKTFRTRTSKIGIISPGEPFNVKEAGIDWLMNWYVVRERGVALFGPPPEAFIDPISKEEFVQAVVAHARAWGDWLEHLDSRPYQAYAILTMCRALYAYEHGEQVSKKQAAMWAAKEFPEWSSTIENALLWREAWREKVPDPEATRAEAVRFVHFAIGRFLA